MLSYQRLISQPSSFRNLTGISVREFEEIYAEFEVLWQEAEEKRLSRPNRQRAIGGGHKYKLALQNQLLMTLIWLHLYLGTETLGIFFDVNKSTVSRNTRRALSVLRQVGEEGVWWQEPPKKGQGKTLAAALEEHPDLLAVLDVMEQRLERPRDRQQNQAHYSPKQKVHTRKVGLLVNEYGQMRGMTASRPGGVHDLTLFRDSGLLAKIPKQVTVIADRAFDGMYHDLPDHSVGTPHKARRNHPLNEAQKWANRDLSRQRIIVENTICELKHFKVLADRFRHATTLCDDVIRAVIALVNRRIARRVINAGLA
jgi:transposase